ncbi:MAG: hypothetical protein Q4G10_08235, partial [Bacteroidia bacterium]|nr:hypothetical protein [Bacteroidia bacterium]
MKKVLKWVLIALAGLIAAVLVALTIALSPRTLTKIANRIAAEYIEGDASIGRIDVSILKGWPDAAVIIDSVTVTYPHATFAAYDSIPCPAGEAVLLNAGRGADTDTLVTLGHLDAKLNVMAFLRHKTIRVPQARLSGLRAFAHMYSDGAANWNIIKLPESQDTASSAAPIVEAKGISISDIQELVLTDPRDTLFARAAFKTFSFDGTFTLKDGRIGTTAELGIDGDAHFTNSSLGTLEAPVTIDTDAALALIPDGETDIDIKALKAQVAALPLEASGVLKLLGDSTFVNAKAVMENCPVGELKEEYGRFLPGIVAPLRTDATMTLRAEADGWFGSATGILPLIKASVEVPDSHISYEGLMEDGDFDLTLLAETDSQGHLNANLEDLCFDLKGISLKASGRGDDLLGDDPEFKDIKAFACTEFADLVKYLPQSSGISASGDVDLEL